MTMTSSNFHKKNNNLFTKLGIRAVEFSESVVTPLTNENVVGRQAVGWLVFVSRRLCLIQLFQVILMKLATHGPYEV